MKVEIPSLERRRIMPRPLRIFYPGVPHHIVQRGCKRQKIFFDDHDYEYYLKQLGDHLSIYEVEIWTYCLMPNHIHLVLLPNDETSISKVVGLTHKKYSLYLNQKMDWKGTLWESRFKSYGMDEIHTFYALKYVERNPITANIVEKADEYKWSSAKFHIKNESNKYVKLANPYWESTSQWKEYISEPTKKELEKLFEKHERSGDFLGIKLKE